jgi:adenylate kinase
VQKISTGDILRQAVRQGTPLGKKAQTYMDSGNLVPDEIVVGLVEERLGEPDSQTGYIMDGFPRTIAQAEALTKALARAGSDVERVLNFQLADDDLVKRLSGRWSCPDCQTVYHEAAHSPQRPGKCDRCGSALVRRSDDEPQTVRKRLDVYKKQTAPLIDYYEDRGLLSRIDASGSVEDVFKRVLTAIGKG